jgi:hypothetical protein
MKAPGSISRYLTLKLKSPFAPPLPGYLVNRLVTDSFIELLRNELGGYSLLPDNNYTVSYIRIGVKGAPLQAESPYSEYHKPPKACTE